jgi:hypothetical protein
MDKPLRREEVLPRAYRKKLRDQLVINKFFITYLKIPKRQEA